jgi:hypothetical protein
MLLYRDKATKEPNVPPVFCKDCKYYSLPYVYGHCGHPKTNKGEYDLETGKMITTWADFERKPGKKCGPEGKLFEPKEPEPEPEPVTVKSCFDELLNLIGWPSK